MKYREIDIVYGRAGDHTLGAILYKPEVDSRTSLTLLVDVHGGAWSAGDRTSGRYYDRLLARAGIAVLAIDFRQGPDYRHPAASADVAAAVRFARTRDLGFRLGEIGLIGSSSGGHLALLAGLRPDVPEHRTTRISTGDGFVLPEQISARPAFIVALWPVSNPIARYQYVTARLAEADSNSLFRPDRLARGHRAYFRDESEMSQACIQRILVDGDYECLPPAFVVQPELDQNVPVFMSQTLTGAWRNAGGRIRYELYPGVHHGFAHRAGEQTDRCMRHVIEFIRETCQDAGGERRSSS